MTPAIAAGKPRVFCWKEEEGGGAVAGEGLLPMPGQKDDIYEQNQRGGSDEKTESESAPWICVDGRQKVRGKKRVLPGCTKHVVCTGYEELL